MKALVFGATGLIGAHLVERLLKEGAEVTGVSRGKIIKKISSKKYHYISLDISNNKEFSKIRGKFDVVFNLAAHIATGYTTEDAKKCLLINAIGTLNILEFMVKKKINLDLFRAHRDLHVRTNFQHKKKSQRFYRLIFKWVVRAH